VGAIASVAMFRYPKITRRTHRHNAVLVAPNLARWRIATTAALLAGAGLFFTFGSSAVAERLAASGGQNEFRFQFWMPIASLAWQYFPWGSGNGSFVEVYQVAEPTALIQDTYLNHAHNDVLEIAVTLGLPGLALLTLFAIAWLRASIAVFRSSVADDTIVLARVGSLIAAMLALASAVDYPLRTPSIACLFVFAMTWLALGYACERDRMRVKS
jgi:O-antigen ligase